MRQREWIVSYSYITLDYQGNEKSNNQPFRYDKYVSQDMRKQSVDGESHSAVRDVCYYTQIGTLEQQCLVLVTNTSSEMTSMLKRYLVTKSAAITPGLQRGIHVTKIAGLGNINNQQAINVLPRNRFSAGNSLLSPLHLLTFPS